jgi:outer membrane protein assembly factor BamB
MESSAKIFCLLLALAGACRAGDWPTMLGPTYDMHSTETNLLHEFPAGGPRLVWSVPKGDGYAAPAVAGGKLVLFHRLEDKAVVDCMDAQDGRQLWRFTSPTAYRDRYGYNHGPRCSPVISGDAVFTYGADGQLLCLELASGKLRWRHDILKEFALKQNFFGVGSTPLVMDGKVIVNVGASEASVVAFDVRTGKIVWSAADEWGPSYATPVPASLHGQRRVLVFAGGESEPATGGLLILDPDTGKITGRFPWRGRRYESVNGSAPVVIGNQVFVSECYGAGGVLLDVEQSGACRPVWTNKNFGMHFMIAVEKDGALYGVDGHGPGDAFLVAVDLKTGRELWREKPMWPDTVQSPTGPREITTGAARAALLLLGDGRCLCLGEYGDLLWLDLNSRAYCELGRVHLYLAGDSWTPPALANGLLYICQNKRDAINGTPPRLLCYDFRQPSTLHHQP